MVMIIFVDGRPAASSTVRVARSPPHETESTVPLKTNIICLIPAAQLEVFAPSPLHSVLGQVESFPFKLLFVRSLNMAWFFSADVFIASSAATAEAVTPVVSYSYADYRRRQ